MEKNQSEDLALEKILETPREAYVFTEEHIPSIFSPFHKMCILCLSNKRLDIFAKVPRIIFRPRAYKYEVLIRDL